METTATPAARTETHRFLDQYAREVGTTVRVLRAYPADQLELRPHEKLKTARELAWIFVVEQAMAETALTTGFDWSNPSPPPPAPESMDEIVAALEDGQRRVAELVRGMADDELRRATTFPVAPKTMGEVPRMEFLWFLLHDHIHHRGQFSIYLRMAGGRVPSIYGPTADEPWM